METLAFSLWPYYPLLLFHFETQSFFLKFSGNPTDIFCMDKTSIESMLLDLKKQQEKTNIDIKKNYDILKGFQSSWYDLDKKSRESQGQIVDLRSHLRAVKRTLLDGQKSIKESIEKNMPTKLEIVEQNQNIMDIIRRVEKLEKKAS